MTVLRVFQPPALSAPLSSHFLKLANYSAHTQTDCQAVPRLFPSKHKGAGRRSLGLQVVSRMRETTNPSESYCISVSEELLIVFCAPTAEDGVSHYVGIQYKPYTLEQLRVSLFLLRYLLLGIQVGIRASGLGFEGGLGV